MPPTSERVRQHFDQPDRYLSNRFEIDVRAEIVRELLGAPPSLRIVDVGCGDGSVSRQFLADGCRLVMVDASSEMLARCRQGVAPEGEGQVSFHHLDLLRDDFAETFDIVLCLGVLAHVESVDGAIARLAALCRPGGQCVIQFTDATRRAAALTRAYMVLRKGLPGGHGYVTNRVTPAMIMQAAGRQGLVPIASRR